jgi:peroxiredoxin Q/BCP
MRSQLSSKGKPRMKMITIGLIALAIVAVIVAIRPQFARAELLKEGQIAPPFTTQMITGEQEAPMSLADFHGRKVILYFYPKDETSGCTKEACAFRDGYARYTNAGLVVLGCSVDTADAHKDFIRKNSLPFPLLLDPDKKIATAYGAANGIPILGLDRRITYVIDENGKIIKVYPSVDPSTHAIEILNDLGAADATPPAQASPAAPVSN